MRNLDAKNLSSVKGVYFYPSFYDEVLPDTPLRLLKNVSNFSGHDILLGNTLREGDMMFEASFHQSLQSRSKLSIDAIMRVYNFFYKRSTFVQALLTLANLQRLYDMSSSTYEGFRDAIGDVLFNCPTKYFAEVFAKKNGRAFYYVLAHKPSFSVWNSPVATHTDDVSLLFGVPFMLPHLATDKERDLSRRLIVIWTAFAKTGDAVLWRQLQTNTFPTPLFYSYLHPSLSPPQCPHCGDRPNLFHVVWQCQLIPAVPSNPNPTPTSWEERLTDDTATGQQSLVDRAKAVAATYGAPD
ncbi:hypothetical protein HPB47_009429 [Ixodes persulcatus]|uniref:Uncharacterized protein n=1 Tax=Ixodes persulcatus TaxID=34615 RepID=A0AC60P1X4_IXOPE|nr:hypothetical protein HPB47_009429 [Ixodes persulcatus]